MLPRPWERKPERIDGCGSAEAVAQGRRSWKAMEDPAQRAAVPASEPWEEDESCSDDLDRLKWRVGRRADDTSNTHSSLCINTPVTSSPSPHARWRWEEVSFPVLEQALFPPNTHQSWCFKGKVPASNSKISIQAVLMCLGTFPITTAKMSKPEMSSTASLIIH